ncbi:MAG TPA: hypothetical protein ENN40_10795 [Candidatus Aminicenantes bacterium]|nr:hypothetical protein [Candidatus Aminicenantes bacterium]
MKPRSYCLSALLILVFVVDSPLVAQDLNLGNIHIPRAFVHGDTSYEAGVYRLVLTEKEGDPWFHVHDAQGNRLFEEMGVVKTEAAPRMRRAFRLQREMLRGYEYYRVRVIQPHRWVMAYFLLKK